MKKIILKLFCWLGFHQRSHFIGTSIEIETDWQLAEYQITYDHFVCSNCHKHHKQARTSSFKIK